ncbi:MAG: GGDEF domain-containing protein, partial [Campylobacterota bacterium]|nr:GGDEF domain-containing protein [Campylobacterota bacterium]
LYSQTEVEQIHSIFKEKNPKLSFIGTTTAGEILDEKSLEKGIVVSIFEFENTEVEHNYFKADEAFKTGETIVKTLFKANTKACILLADGFTTNISDLLDGITSLDEKMPIAGGLAADYGAMSETLIFDENGIYKEGVLATTLHGNSLKVFTNYQLNWQAVGNEMTVTKVDKNHLYKLDNIPVCDIYRKYLGDNVADGLPWSATEFPLLKLENNGLEICRAFIHKFEEDNSVLTVGNLELGDKVKFSFGNINMITNSAKSDIQEYGYFKPEAISVYSCAARKAFLQENISMELKPLSNIAPTAGFFTSGEIYHQDDKNVLLSISLTILGLSEVVEDIKIDTFTQKNISNHNESMLANKHYLVLDALTNLSNTVIQELNEAQEELKSQASRDYLTNLYNRRYFNDISEHFLNTAKRENKLFSVLMLDIDKFKIVNDTYGHLVGDEVIKALANLLVLNTRKNDVVSRFGGEEFAILLPFTDKSSALTIAEKLRKLVENESIKVDNTKTIKFTISIGINEINHIDDESITQALDRADMALYEAKNMGRNRVVAY